MARPIEVLHPFSRTFVASRAKVLHAEKGTGITKAVRNFTAFKMTERAKMRLQARAVKGGYRDEVLNSEQGVQACDASKASQQYQPLVHYI